MYGSAWQASDGCGGNSDSPEVHYKDIMNSALGMADAKLAKILSEESPERLRELENWGFKLVKDPENKKPHYSGYSCFASQPRAHGMLANSNGGHTGNLIEVNPTVKIVITPPKTTAFTVPISFAVKPLSKAPSSFDEPTKIELTEATLPRTSSGVLSCNIV